MSFSWTAVARFSDTVKLLDFMKRNIQLSVFCLFALCACSPSPPAASDASSAQESQSKSDESKGPLIAPPGDLALPLPGQTGRLKDANGLPIMPPAKGMKLGSMLFSEKIKDDDKRFERLENAVQEMRQEFDALLPSLIRLVALEKDIQGLTTQLEVMLGNQPSPPLNPDESMASSSPPGIQSEALSPAPLTPVGPPSPPDDTDLAQTHTEPIEPAEPPQAVTTPPPQAPPAPPGPPDAAAPEKPPESPPPAAQNAAVTVEDIRLTESNGKTRLVLSLSGEAGYSHTLSGDPPVLRIVVGGAKLSEAAKAKTLQSALVKSWRHESEAGSGAAILSFDLATGASIARAFTIGSQEGHNLRLVFDMQ